MTGNDFTDRHTVSAFDDELRELRGLIAEMGGLAEAALAHALDALAKGDVALAEQVVADDRAIDALEARVGQQVVTLIAKRAPLADDLREILAAYRIAGIVERTGDYAKTIAKRIPAIDRADVGEPMRLLAELGRAVLDMMRQALNAFAARDIEAARAVGARDREADDLYNRLFLALLAAMMQDPAIIRPSTHLLFVGKSLERVGDQATNLAELVYFAATGEELADRHAE
ncbi:MULTISPECIES: phosphate signaling complex protein PhoU [unclassified Sphingomonas]|uniref:phosphate signaling complex protein PhoU n=1 Tax=unclassified Sphingomonas TaxID=196159 RepID=UPI001F55CFD3|nr:MULTISPECIES: phosphate signaling complex protein PhoU [unclassified Sphingomonas]